MVNETIQQGQPWTDTEFPPERSSLYDIKIDQVDVKTFNSITWKRASDIFNSVYVFEDSIEPNDVC